MSAGRLKRAAKALRRRLAPSGVIVFVAAFIGADLIEASGWDWQGWLRELRGRPEQPADLGELRDYVEFVTITRGNLEIVTGIRFASSANRRITRQWCYAEPARQLKGTIVFRVDLGLWVPPGPVERHALSPESLTRLGLDAAGAQSLFDNHCRFRNQ